MVCSHAESASLNDLPRLEQLLLRRRAAGRRNMEDEIRSLLQHPSRGCVFMVRSGERAVAMACCNITVSTAEGGFVLWMEDLVVDQENGSEGDTGLLLKGILAYARRNGFRRITAAPGILTPETCRALGFVESNMIAMSLQLPA